MKTLKIIASEEVKEGDLLILDGGRVFFARELSDVQANDETKAGKRRFGRKVREERGGGGEDKMVEKKRITNNVIGRMKVMKEDGMTSGEIADELGLSLEQVNKHYPGL